MVPRILFIILFVWTSAHWTHSACVSTPLSTHQGMGSFTKINSKQALMYTNWGSPRTMEGFTQPSGSAQSTTLITEKNEELVDKNGNSTIPTVPTIVDPKLSSLQTTVSPTTDTGNPTSMEQEMTAPTTNARSIDDDDDTEQGDDEWESNSTITTVPTSDDPKLPTLQPTTSNATDTVKPSSIEQETTAPINVHSTTLPPINSVTHIPWSMNTMTDIPTITPLTSTNAPSSSIPTNPSTSNSFITSAPTTYNPTYFPSYSPTHGVFPVSSEPSTISPTSSFPSHAYYAVTSNPPTTKITTSPPSTMAPLAPQQGIFSISPSSSSSKSSIPSSAPSQASMIVEGILTFQLKMERLLNNIPAFESIAGEFLQEHLSSKLILDYNSEIMFSSYDIVVASQTLVPHTESVATSSNFDLLRKRMLRESAILFVVATVTAKGTPAELASDFPFQTAISYIITEKSDEFHSKLLSSDEFKDTQTPEQTLDYVQLNSSNSRINKPIVLGSSIAGAVALLLFTGACFSVQRHQRQRENLCVEPPDPCTLRGIDEEVGKSSCSNLDFRSSNFPHTVPSFLDENGNDMSSLEDSLNSDYPKTVSEEDSDLPSLEISLNNYSKMMSFDGDTTSEDSRHGKENVQSFSCEDLSCFEDSLNPANYPQNVPHIPFSFDGDVSINIGLDIEKQTDEWSLGDNFPVMQAESRMTSFIMNHSNMTDSDESSTTLSITSTDLEDSLLSYVEQACTVHTNQEGRSLESYVGTIKEEIPPYRKALKLAGMFHK